MPKWTSEQLEAINKEGSNIIISAGAGSGKTAVLTQRVIRKLKEGVNINELLVLTFTNAAAFEMKERIRKAITENPNLKDQLSLIDGAYITTFDSYALSLVKKYHYLLNISSDVNILDNSIIYMVKKDIINKIFDTMYNSNNHLFNKLITDFSLKDDKEIKEGILNISNKLDLKYDKKEYLDNYIEQFFSKQKIDEYIFTFTSYLKQKIEEIKSAYEDLCLYIDESFYESIKNDIENLISSTKLDEIILYHNIELPRLNKNCLEQAKELKENLNTKLKELKTLITFNSEEELKDSYLLTKDYVVIIIDILKTLDSEVDKFKYQYNLFEFNDISKMAIRVLKENSKVLDELKYSFKEIMVDEYQDTSDLQETFINLLQNNNVYMVGDIKQSIYRFRNANPYIFKNKYNNYSKNNGGYKIDLVKNFRSRSEVLNNINLIFDLIMDEELGGANYTKGHQMIFGNLAYNEQGLLKSNNDMEIYNYEYQKLGYSKDEIEAFIIANDIKQKIDTKYQVFDVKNNLIRNITYSDFAIILDRSTSFDLYKKIFEYLNIPLIKYTSTNITDEYDVILLKNIIALLLDVYKQDFSINYKYNYISIARSFLFSYTDNQILEIVINNNYKGEILDIINNIVKDLEYLSLTEIIKRIIADFKFYEKTIKVGFIDSAYIRMETILNQAKTFEKMGYTIDQFYNYLNTILEDNIKMETNISSTNSDSVKIMTIHKSKGLEYHICYFAGLYKEFNLKELKNLFMYDNNYGIITPYYQDGIDETFLKKLIKKQYQEEEISEKIRLFYVALTRAKEKMIFICDLNDTKETSKDENNLVDISNRLKYKSFLDILKSIKNDISLYLKNIKLEDLNLTKDYMIIKETNIKEHLIDNKDRVISKEIEMEKEELKQEHYSKENKKLITKEEQQKMEFGTKVHEILEHLDFKNPNLDNILYKDKINAFLNCGIDFKTPTIYKEHEFIYQNKHGIIDLLLEYPDKILIIDYKLKNINDDNYIKQLEGYKEYIKTISSKEIKIYLYSIIDEELKEINLKY